MAQGGARLREWWEHALRGRSRRAWTALLAWPLALIVGLAAVVRVLGLERGVLLVQLASFTPYAAAGAGLVGLGTALARRPAAATAAGLATAALLACVLPRALGSPTAEAGTPLVVMSVNLRLGGADPGSVVALARDAHVDILALQEFTPEAERGLLAAGVADVLPYRESHPDERARGSALFARLPLTDGGVRRASAEGYLQAHASVTLAGRTYVVESVHPVPPLDSYLEPYWIAGVDGQVGGRAPGPSRILAGDFNATLDHVALRRLLATGYRDAADSVGQGLTPTWPYYGGRARVTPRITLDHVLVSGGIGVRDFQAVTVPRTDHRAIVATLVLP